MRRARRGDRDRRGDSRREPRVDTLDIATTPAAATATSWGAVQRGDSSGACLSVGAPRGVGPAHAGPTPRTWKDRPRMIDDPRMTRSSLIATGAIALTAFAALVGTALAGRCCAHTSEGGCVRRHRRRHLDRPRPAERQGADRKPLHRGGGQLPVQHRAQPRGEADTQALARSWGLSALLPGFMCISGLPKGVQLQHGGCSVGTSPVLMPTAGLKSFKWQACVAIPSRREHLSCTTRKL